MARKVSSIGEVDDTKDTWKLAVRITDLWSVQKSPRAATIEMVFIDDKGDKIHATVQPPDYNDRKNELQEGKPYIVQNFEVHSNDGHYRVYNHRYRLVFTKATVVKEHNIPAIPKYVYHFADFEDIISGKSSPNVSVDIIGEFVDFAEPPSESTKKKVVCCLRNQRNTSLNCTLWGEYASRMLCFLGNCKPGPIVLLLTLAKIKEPKGNYPVAIQNSMYGSKLYINKNIKEIEEYKNSLDSSMYSESFSQWMIQLSSCSQLKTQDKFSLNADFKSVTEINTLMQESYCLTVGKVDKIIANNGWKYDACSKCTKGGNANAVPYTCSGCGQTVYATIPRYRIEIKVSYCGESIKMVLWDNESFQLIKHTAAKLKKLMIDDGETDDKAIPAAVDDLVGKTLGFKVKVQPTYKRCSVVAVTEDFEIIDTIVKKIQNEKDVVSVQKGKSISCADKEDELLESQSLSATADFDPDLLESLTPAKRLTSDIQIDTSQDSTSYQFSSTKLTKHLKTE